VPSSGGIPFNPSSGGIPLNLLSRDVKLGRGKPMASGMVTGSGSKQARKLQQLSTSTEQLQPQGPSMEELGLTSELCAFLAILRAAKVNMNSQTILLENGVDSVEALDALLPGDLGSLGLQLGQRRLLEQLVTRPIVSVHGGDVAPTAAMGSRVSDSLDANGSRPAAKDCSADSQGRLNTNLFLGFGVNGEQSP
jgi:hypothetical protein